MDNVADLGLPKVDSTLVALMGLSQAGYLGYKGAIPQREIYEIKQDIDLATVGANNPLPITIIGKNFGNQKEQLILTLGDLVVMILLNGLMEE
jgi:hypothetical protein